MIPVEIGKDCRGADGNHTPRHHPDERKHSHDFSGTRRPRRHTSLARRVDGGPRVGGGRGMESRSVRQRELLRPGSGGVLHRAARRRTGLGRLGRQLRRRLRLPGLLPRTPRPARPRLRHHHLEDGPGSRRRPDRRSRRGGRAAGQLPSVRLRTCLPHLPVRWSRARGGDTDGSPARRGCGPRGRHGVRQHLLPGRPAAVPGVVAERPGPPCLRPPHRRTSQRVRRDPPGPRRPAHRPAVRRHRRGRPGAVRRADRRGRREGGRHRHPRDELGRSRARPGVRPHPSFDTARMYTGPVETFAGERVYGVTTLELG